MTIYSLDVLLFLFASRLFFIVSRLCLKKKKSWLAMLKLNILLYFQNSFWYRKLGLKRPYNPIQLLLLWISSAAWLPSHYLSAVEAPPIVGNSLPNTQVMMSCRCRLPAAGMFFCVMSRDLDLFHLPLDPHSEWIKLYRTSCSAH